MKKTFKERREKVTNILLLTGLAFAFLSVLFLYPAHRGPEIDQNWMALIKVNMVLATLAWLIAIARTIYVKACEETERTLTIETISSEPKADTVMEGQVLPTHCLTVKFQELGHEYKFDWHEKDPPKVGTQIRMRFWADPFGDITECEAIMKDAQATAAAAEVLG